MVVKEITSTSFANVCSYFLSCAPWNVNGVWRQTTKTTTALISVMRVKRFVRSKRFKAFSVVGCADDGGNRLWSSTSTHHTRRIWEKETGKNTQFPFCCVCFFCSDCFNLSLVFRMVEAEEEYLEQLQLMVSCFLRPFKMAASSQKPPCNHDEVNSIFLNAETVMFLHQIFLKGLTARMECWPTLVLGMRLFLELRPYFKSIFLARKHEH